MSGKPVALLKSTGFILSGALKGLEFFMVTCPSDFNISCVKVVMMALEERSKG